MKNYISKKTRLEILKLKPCVLLKEFPKIFSWDELERLINLRPFASNTRLRFINNESYQWGGQAWLTDPNTYPPSLIEEELKKYHCYFSDASRANEKLNKICGELENTFEGHASDAHIYFTTADTTAGGFGIHYDSAHNLIVQVEGSTRFMLWDVYVNKLASPRVVESLPVDPVIDVTLHPGDAVFVPMYSYHQALSQSKRLSVSFPVTAPPVPPQDRHWVKLRVDQ